jgi:hypothetical protein
MAKPDRPKLFDYAVLYHPKPKKVEDEEVREPSKLIVEPDTLLAGSQEEAVILIARQIPDEYLDKLPDVEIAIRPF